MSTAGFMPPAEFDDYKVLRPLGKGGMGRVYLGHDLLLDRPVAIKFIDAELPTAQSRERFRIEAVALARLQHPNVMSVYRSSQVAGRPYIVGEFVGGQGLDQLPRPVSRQRLLELALGLARGLAAVHQRGVLHRDLKPSNVILAPDGQIKLVDFGIAKLVGAAPDPAGEHVVTASALDAGEGVASRPAQLPLSLSVTRSMEASGADGCAKGSPRVAAGLTQAGTLLGTPVFMAPELWRGEAATTCSDVYALGAMLYQLGAGRLPYDADEQEALAQQVQERDAPPLASVAPGISPRLAAIIDRCLCRDPRHRPASGEELCAELEHLAGWQVLRRRLAWAATAGLALVLLLSIAGNALLGWVKTRRAVAVYLAEAATAHEQAHRQNLALAALRGQAFAAFDGRRIQDGERLWSQVKTLSAECYQTYQRAGQLLETALFHAPREQEIRRRIAENLYEQAEIFDRDHRLQQRDDALARLDSHAVDGQVGAIVRRWREPGVVSLATTPAGASVEVAQYEPGVAGSLTLRPLRTFGPTPILELRLAPGSYLLLLRAAGRSEVRVPLVVHHGERVTLDVALPHRTAVPPGFLYVPAGRFLFGVAGEERLRSLLGIVPLHERRLEAYLIAKTETTFGDWIEFLDALPRQQREAHRPHSGEQTAQGGQFGLQSTPDGSWTITLGPTDQQRHTARLGEPIVYAGRERRASVDWRQLPVVGIDLSDAQAYLSWLGSTGRVPGARLCTEAEWERAARGADDRQYPHGDLLNPDDANFDLTYRQNGLAMGPDEVGSHPASRSPFGIDDLTGNVWEWTESSLATGQFVLRGGAYYYDKVTVLSFNRETVGKSTRNQRLGLRVCAPAPITR